VNDADVPKARRGAKVEDEEDQDQDAEENSREMSDMLRQMPPELQEAYRLMSISKATGDEEAQKRANELCLQAIEKGGPEVQATFMQEVSKHNPEAADKLGFPKPKTEGGQDQGDKIDRLKVQMEEGREATRKQMEALSQQQEQLEGIKSPEDFMAFMQKEGMTDVDVQRMMGSDTNHMEDLVKKMLDNATGTTSDSLESAEKAIKATDDIYTSLYGESPEVAPPKTQVAVAKPKNRQPPSEDEVQIPNHRLQYTKDEDGRYTAVELIVTLPGVADMSSINLDVSEKHLRLNTGAPGPKFAVNAGPFPVLIDPSAARAKFSKKRQELSLFVPAKQS